MVKKRWQKKEKEKRNPSDIQKGIPIVKHDNQDLFEKVF